MKTFKIHLPLESYIHNGKVDDFGEIHIKLNNYAFPDKEWTDFGLIIIYWWMDAFLKLLSGEEKKVGCDFMDGNFRFDVEIMNSPQTWHISLIKEWADSEEIKDEGKVDVKQATDEILRVIAEIKDLDIKLGKAEYVRNINSFTQKFLLAKQNYSANAG
jgi:hypothetical protein